MSATLEKPVKEQVPRQKESRPDGRLGVDKVVLILIAIYFLVPLLSTLVFAFSDGKNFSLKGLSGIFNDLDLGRSLPFSLELAVASTLLTILLVTPTA